MPRETPRVPKGGSRCDDFKRARRAATAERRVVAPPRGLAPRGRRGGVGRKYAPLDPFRSRDLQALGEAKVEAPGRSSRPSRRRHAHSGATIDDNLIVMRAALLASLASYASSSLNVSATVASLNARYMLKA